MDLPLVRDSRTRTESRAVVSLLSLRLPPRHLKPYEVSLAPGVESYGMVARYTLGGPFALLGSQPTK